MSIDLARRLADLLADVQTIRTWDEWFLCGDWCDNEPCRTEQFVSMLQEMRRMVYRTESQVA